MSLQDCAELGLHLLHSNTGFQPSDNVKPPTARRALEMGIAPRDMIKLSNRNGDIRRRSYFQGPKEFRGRNADNRKRSSAEVNGFTDRCWIAAEPAQPVTIADDRRGC